MRLKKVLGGAGVNSRYLFNLGAGKDMKPGSRRHGFTAQALLPTLSVSLIKFPSISVPRFLHLHNGWGAEDRKVRLSALVGPCGSETL